MDVQGLERSWGDARTDGNLFSIYHQTESTSWVCDDCDVAMQTCWSSVVDWLAHGMWRPIGARNTSDTCDIWRWYNSTARNVSAVMRDFDDNDDDGGDWWCWGTGQVLLSGAETATNSIPIWSITVNVRYTIEWKKERPVWICSYKIISKYTIILINIANLR